MYTQEQTHKILVNARNYLETYGWCRRSFGTANGPVCLMGAVSMSAGYSHPVDMPLRKAREVAKILGFRGLWRAVSFNDHNPYYIVLKRLDEAIERTAPVPSDPFPQDSVKESSHDFSLSNG